MSSRRPPRDPAAPKRNMSAYLLYQNAMRDTFKQQNPGMTFGQLSKYTSVSLGRLAQMLTSLVSHVAPRNTSFVHFIYSYAQQIR